jgi:hypothetical protein
MGDVMSTVFSFIPFLLPALADAQKLELPGEPQEPLTRSQSLQVLQKSKKEYQFTESKEMGEAVLGIKLKNKTSQLNSPLLHVVPLFSFASMLRQNVGK